MSWLPGCMRKIVQAYYGVSRLQKKDTMPMRQSIIRQAYRQTALVARQSHSTKNPMIWRECQLTEYRTVYYIQDSKEKETKASQDYAFAVQIPGLTPSAMKITNRGQLRYTAVFAHIAIKINGWRQGLIMVMMITSLMKVFVKSLPNKRVVACSPKPTLKILRDKLESIVRDNHESIVGLRSYPRQIFLTLSRSLFDNAIIFITRFKCQICPDKAEFV